MAMRIYIRDEAVRLRICVRKMVLADRHDRNSTHHPLIVGVAAFLPPTVDPSDGTLAETRQKPLSVPLKRKSFAFCYRK